MKQLTSLIWKELHEARWFLAVALLLFVIMPVLGWVEGTILYNHSAFYFDASPWVGIAGSGLAILVAVGSVCRDLNGKLEQFWRSRAVSAGQWLLVKYLVGMAVVLVSCVAPLLLEIQVNSRVMVSDTRAMMTWYPFLWMALYSLSFVAACMVRRVAHATMLSLAALLLVYFLPIVIPFLQYLSIDWVMGRSHELRSQWRLASELPWHVWVESRQLWFIAGMGVMCLASSIISVEIVRRDWRIESSTKLLYASVGAAALILFTSAAFRLASNLPILQQIDLAPYEEVADLRVDGMRGLLFTSERNASAAASAHLLSLTPGGVEMGPAITMPRNRRWAISFTRIAWSAANPNIFYALGWERVENHLYALNLQTILLDGSALPPPVQLWQYVDGTTAHPIIMDGRLYVLGDRISVLDISNPAQPRLVSTEPLRWDNSFPSSARADISLQLPPIPGLSPRQRLEASLAGRQIGSIEGELMAVAGSDLVIYHLEELTDRDAQFKRVGEYKLAFLEQFFGASSYTPIMANGRVYTSSILRADTAGMRFTAQRVNVFDVRDPTRPKEVGHFAVPSKWGLSVHPLPDGRALIGGGNKLYLVGGPPAKS